MWPFPSGHIEHQRHGPKSPGRRQGFPTEACRSDSFGNCITTRGRTASTNPNRRALLRIAACSIACGHVALGRRRSDPTAKCESERRSASRSGRYRAGPPPPKPPDRRQPIPGIEHRILIEVDRQILAFVSVGDRTLRIVQHCPRRMDPRAKSCAGMLHRHARRPGRSRRRTPQWIPR